MKTTTILLIAAAGAAAYFYAQKRAAEAAAKPSLLTQAGQFIGGLLSKASGTPTSPNTSTPTADTLNRLAEDLF